MRVNCIAPGLVKTDFARALWENEEGVKRRNAATPLRRIGMPDEIGGVGGVSRGTGGELHHRAGDRGGWRGDDYVSLHSPRPAKRGEGRERSEGGRGASSRALSRLTLRVATLSRKRERGKQESRRYYFFWLRSSYLRSSSRATASSCTASGPSTMRIVRVRA